MRARLARNSKGQFLPRGNPHRRRRHKKHAARRNPSPAWLATANPRRRKSHRRAAVHHRRRRYQRNPGFSLAGFTLPSVQTMAWTGAGFLAPSFAEGFIRQYLPVQLYTSAIGRYAIKIGTVLGLGFLTDKLAGSEARNKVLLGGSVYVIANLAADYMPMLTGATAPPPASLPGTAKYRPVGVGHQPMIGRYSPLGSAMTTNTPERLRPENRY